MDTIDIIPIILVVSIFSLIGVNLIYEVIKARMTE
jgi:hypothetical protein